MSSATEYDRLRAATVRDSTVSELYAVNGASKLGQGAFGVVYEGTRKADAARVAVKYISSKLYSTLAQRTEALREPFILHRVNAAGNPNILRLFTAHEEVLPTNALRLVIVTEKAEGGELFDRLVKISHYAEADASRVAHAMFTAIQASHNAGVIHRDLKPENVLLRAPLGAPGADEIVICDFGLACLTSEGVASVQAKAGPIGTYAYMAPEIWTARTYSPASDVWALGVLLYILLVGFPPFWAGDNNDITGMMANICAGRYEFYEDAWGPVSAEAKDLVKRLLTVDVGTRITLPQALAHPWFTHMHAREVKALPATLTKLRGFNAKRKFRASALAVMFGAAGMRAAHHELASLLGGRELSPEQLAGLAQTFNAATGAGSALEYPGLVKVLEGVGIHFEPSVVNRMFMAFDRDFSGSIDLRELVTGLAALSKGDAASLRLIFNLFDTDGSGCISKPELGQLLASTGFFAGVCGEGEPLALNPAGVETSAEAAALEALFSSMDANHDERVTFDEFKAAVSADATLAHALLRPLRHMAGGGGGGFGAAGAAAAH